MLAMRPRQPPHDNTHETGPLSTGAIGRFLVPQPLPKTLLYAEPLRRRMRVRFGGRWIVDLIPWWVAALTHLVFGWTMLLVQPLGVFVPYHSESEEAGT